MKILLVEDDDVLIKVLTQSLTSHHYIVDAVKDGEKGWIYGSTFEYDLILLDIGLPKLDGISLCKRFRAEGYTTPILLLTAQDARTVKVQGLDAGADDYVVKPFDQAELIARIRALLRRGSANPLPTLTWGDLFLNPSACEVNYNGQSLSLTTKEYELLELLLWHSQSVFSTDDLIDRLWSSEEFPSEATVRSHIRRVRQKLTAAGAPRDLIANMHGRGYYLKPTSASTPSDQNNSINVDGIESSPAVPAAPLSARELLRPDARQQYLDFLNQTWSTTKATSLGQVTVLLETTQRLQANCLTPQQQAKACQIAHTLAGTMGIFGLTKTVHLARQLEHWMGERKPLKPHHAPLMKTLVLVLQQELQNITTIEQHHIPTEQLPLLLLISSDEAFNQSLVAAASNCGIQTEIAPTLESVVESLELQPHAILLRFPAELDQLTEPDQVDKTDQRMVSHSLEALQTLAHRYPTLPILVISDRLNCCDRLKVLRSGGKLLLETPTSPEQIMTTVVHLLGKPDLPPKVMIVDDDRAWLKTMPTLLKPWGFKVITLADPQQFWSVLQSVTPDVLVLDVNMPQINGFELCQVLRSDPRWQRLPVLFLSVRIDPASQDQAFTVGADDYLCKPVKGVALANRILSRLSRVHACAS
jgi:DNA-binding response OmpR family regulator/HPt (histidine-containing phosphotransfer) domain-containing protein